MLKYRGLYRVAYEIDKVCKPCEFCFLLLRIKKGANIYRHNDTTLNAYIPSKTIVKRLAEKYPDLFKVHSLGDFEGILLFPESKLPEAAEILKPYTKGKYISPRSKRNQRYNKNT